MENTSLPSTPAENASNGLKFKPLNDYILVRPVEIPEYLMGPSGLQVAVKNPMDFSIVVKSDNPLIEVGTLIFSRAQFFYGVCLEGAIYAVIHKDYIMGCIPKEALATEPMTPERTKELHDAYEKRLEQEKAQAAIMAVHKVNDGRMKQMVH